MEISLEYPGGPSEITRVFSVAERGIRAGQRERSDSACGVRERPCGGFEDGGRWPLKAGKGRETDSLPQAWKAL